jgi:hypothetical protein
MQINTKAAVLLSLLVVTVGVVFWPTLYRYDRLDAGNRSVPMRINRITGRVEILRGGDWSDLRPKGRSSPTRPTRRLIDAEQTKITGGAGKLDYGFFSTPIHNGTVCELTTLYVTMRLPNENLRAFKQSVSVRPLSAGEMSFPVGTNTSETFISWWIDSAYGACPRVR